MKKIRVDKYGRWHGDPETLKQLDEVLARWKAYPEEFLREAREIIEEAENAVRKNRSQ